VQNQPTSFEAVFTAGNTGAQHLLGVSSATSAVKVNSKLLTWFCTSSIDAAGEVLGEAAYGEPDRTPDRTAE